MVWDTSKDRIKLIRSRHHYLVAKGIIRDDVGILPNFIKEDKPQFTGNDNLKYDENEYTGTEDEKDFEFYLDQCG